MSVEVFGFDNELPSNEEEEVSLLYEEEELPERDIFVQYDYQTARRIQNATTILNNHSLLALNASEGNEPITLIRAKFLAMLNPNWTPEKETELFSSKCFQKSLEFSKSSTTFVTPSNSMLETFEESRPASYSSSFSPNSFKSPGKLRFTDQ